MPPPFPEREGWRPRRIQRPEDDETSECHWLHRLVHRGHEDVHHHGVRERRGPVNKNQGCENGGCDFPGARGHVYIFADRLRLAPHPRAEGLASRPEALERVPHQGRRREIGRLRYRACPREHRGRGRNLHRVAILFVAGDLQQRGLRHADGCVVPRCHRIRTDGAQGAIPRYEYGRCRVKNHQHRSGPFTRHILQGLGVDRPTVLGEGAQDAAASG
mmetsp:Transcript_83695/g.233411  ORF Transcript_83695/g.233411 Transcript_83695/m.233411 type:complete len:217 (-) Transcript_83695:812-1462(-)